MGKVQERRDELTMKKPFKLIITSVAAAFVLAACQAPAPATAPPEASTDADQVTEVADEEVVRIGFSLAERDQWLTYLEIAATERAAELGVELTVFDAQRDINQQLSHIQSFAAQGFDAIIVNVVDPAFTDAMIMDASGTPVVFVNRMPAEHVLEENFVAFVGSDEGAAGELQAEFLTEYFADHDGPVNYVMLLGLIGHPGTTARTAAFRESMEAAGFDLNTVFEQTANFDRAEAMDIMQQFLGTGQHFDVVVSNNDEMALGAIEAMRAVGIDDIPVVGIDASPHGVASIAAGEMAASPFQNPVGQGAGAVDKALSAAMGQGFPMITWIPFELVTAENVADYQ